MGLLSKKEKSKLPSELNDELDHGKALRSETEQDSDIDPEKIKRPKVKPNPYPVYFLFWSTLFFCLSFLAYRKLSVYLKQGQPIAPQVNFSFSPSSITFLFKKITGGINTNLKSTDLSDNITSLLQENSRNWGILAEVYPTNTTDTAKRWSYNPDLLDPITPADLLYQLKKTSPNTSSFLSTNLPQGVTIRQTYLESDQTIKLDALLSVPTKDLLVSIKANNQIDISRASKAIPQIVSTIYWSFAGSN